MKLVEKKVRSRVDLGVYFLARSKVDSRIWSQVRLRVWSQVDVHVCLQVKSNIWFQIEDRGGR